MGNTKQLGPKLDAAAKGGAIRTSNREYDNVFEQWRHLQIHRVDEPHRLVCYQRCRQSMLESPSGQPERTTLTVVTKCLLNEITDRF